MNWELASQIAQVIATLLAAVGIVVSLWIGIKALREVQADRVHRVRPKLLFDRGGQRVTCVARPLSGIPGIDPASSAKLLSSLPRGAKGWYPTTRWGKLCNHGNGSAINTAVTFLARRVTKAGETFTVDQAKLLEYPYSPSLNIVPADPSNIDSGESGLFYRIPTPVLVDYTNQLASIEYVVSVTYEDMYRTKYTTLQELTVFVRRDGDNADLTLTFSNEIAAVDENLLPLAMKNLPV